MGQEHQIKLFEFILATLIVAILSAILFSKYLDFQSRARTIKMENIYGAMKTAATLARTVCLLEVAGLGSSSCTEKAGKANLAGTLVAMVNQYPAATKEGIMNAMHVDSSGLTITGSNPLLIDVTGTELASCRISYFEAEKINLPPKMTINIEGC